MRAGLFLVEPLYPNFKLWIYNTKQEGVWGDGKMKLLSAIEEQGSLSGAAEQLGISYRKAWGDLKKAESCLGLKLLVKERGGKGGGKSALTPESRKLLQAYKRFREASAAEIQKNFEKFVTEVQQ